MNEVSEMCIANIVSWRVLQAAYRNTNPIITECIITLLVCNSAAAMSFASHVKTIFASPVALIIKSCLSAK